MFGFSMDNGRNKIFGFDPAVLLWTLISVYILYFFSLSVVRYFSFDFKDMDLAAYDQIIRNINRGTRFSSILGVDFLGHHAHFLAYPVALFYKLVPHPLTLLALQTFAIGLTAWPLYLIAVRFLTPKMGLLVVAAYFLYPAVAYLNAYEFHFTVFATFFLMWGFYFFFAERLRLFLVAMALGLLCQENMSLVLVAFGLYAIVLRRGWQWWAPLILAGTVYALWYVRMVVPALNPDTINFVSIYSHLGDSHGQIIANLLARPWEILRYITEPPRLWWLYQLFAPLAFIPWFGPLHFLPSLPLFLQHLLSNRSQEINLYFHYTAELIPFIFVALVFGLRRLTSLNGRRTILPVLLSVTVLLFAIEGPYGELSAKFLLLRKDACHLMERMLALLPPAGAVVTTFEFMPRLSDRTSLYSFHHIYSGHFTLSSKPYLLPEPVDHALLNTNDGLTFGSFYNRDGSFRLRKLLADNTLEPVAVRDNLVLFSRVKNAPFSFTRGLFEVRQGAVAGYEQDAFFSDGKLSLDQIEYHHQGEVLYLRLVWRVLEQVSRDLSLSLAFLNKDGKKVSGLVLPACYRIFPTTEWVPGMMVVEYRYLTIPVEVTGESFSLRVGLYDEGARKSLGLIGAIFIAPEAVGVQRRNNP